MDRYALALVVGLTVTLTLRAIPTTAQEKGAPPNVGKTAPQTDSSKPQPRRADGVANPANGRQQNRDANQAGTTQAPPAVQPLQPANASQQTPAVTRQNEQQAREQPVTVRSIPSLDVRKDWADYSQLVFTLLLFAVAIWQIWLLHQTVDATQTAAKAAKDSAETATAVLNMTHRPRLAIRHVVVQGIGHDGRVGNKLSNGYILVTNVGALRATLQYVYADWLYAETLPIENPALNAPDNSTEPVIMPTASFKRIPIPDREITTGEYIHINNMVEAGSANFQDEVGSLFLFGYLKFTDTIGLRRRYFCFRYNTDLHYFTAVKHPSYSYED
jgi:hypothetical protein